MFLSPEKTEILQQRIADIEALMNYNANEYSLYAAMHDILFNIFDSEVVLNYFNGDISPILDADDNEFEALIDKMLDDILFKRRLQNED